MESFASFQDKFGLPHNLVWSSGHWHVSVRPKQPTVGSLVLSLQRPCERLAEITGEEAADLSAAFAAIERALGAAYSPDKVNYLALMMVDPHVHFHVLPRYADERTVRGHAHRDAAWPGPPDLAPLPLSSEDLAEVKQVLTEFFHLDR